MKTGIAVIDCPQCGNEQLHTVVLIGPDIYLCCRQCRSVTLMDAGSDRAPKSSFTAEAPPRYII